jgi:hypothetical protein
MVVAGIFGMLGKKDRHCAGSGSRFVICNGTMGSREALKGPQRLLKKNFEGKKFMID